LGGRSAVFVQLLEFMVDDMKHSLERRVLLRVELRASFEQDLSIARQRSSRLWISSVPNKPRRLLACLNIQRCQQPIIHPFVAGQGLAETVRKTPVEKHPEKQEERGRLSSVAEGRVEQKNSIKRGRS
jgi:hypothetical protein